MSYVSHEKVYDWTRGEGSMTAIVANYEHAPHEKSLEIVIYEVGYAQGSSRELVCIQKMLVGKIGCENARVISKHVEEGPEVADFEADLWYGLSKGPAPNERGIFAVEAFLHEVFF